MHQTDLMNSKSQLFPGIAVLMLLFLFGCSEDSFEAEWHQEDGYRWAELPVSDSGPVGFEMIPSSRTGITINNFLSDERMNENRVLMNGSGVAAGDITGNGLPDLYFARIDGPNKLYKNLGGFRFEDITEQAGVAHENHLSAGAVFADVNGNGHLDLLITSIDSENALYLNDGEGRFEYQENSGLGPARGSMTMALADVNGNGYLDLYVVNYREINVVDVFDVQELVWENTVQDGELVEPYDDYFTILDRGEGFPPERHEIGREDEFYFNNGDGTFSKVEDPENMFLASDGSPLGFYPDWGLAAKFHDLNGNGLPDLYVSNDYWTPDRVWMNQGDGTFRAIDTLAMRNSSFYSMTVDFSDVSRNGHLDIFTVEMLNDKHSDRLQMRLPTEPFPLLPGDYENRPRYNRNSLFLNRGDNTYAEISYYSGVHATEWSWATRFIDLNLDGYEDLLVKTGFAFDFQNLDSQRQMLDHLIATRGAARNYVEDFDRLLQQNRIFKNNGDLTFTDLSSDWGFTEKDISLGIALTDLDGNGVLDVVSSRMNDEPGIFKNRALGPRISVRLIGTSPNTQAIGAKLKLTGGPVDHQTKELISGGDYLSGSDPFAVFAADPANENHHLQITWPDGSQTEMDVQPNRMYEIDQNNIASSMPDNSNEESAEPLFSDRTDQLNHRHHESDFNDFRVQPLLPFELSRQGPAVAWLDLTGDGGEELIIGAGAGGKTGIYRVENGNFTPLDIDLLNEEAPGDQTGIVGWKEDGQTHLVIGFANYEQGSARVPSAIHYRLEGGEVVSSDSLPGILSTTGPLAAADYTGDGRVDLFIGGRFKPGQYPYDADSRLFRNDNGTLVHDTENQAVLNDIGLVTGALFVDYNNSGEQDLILTTEWGSLKLFENNGGMFTERTSELGLDRYNGLWQGVAAGDFNGNGYSDLVATNWGENSPYRIENPDRPLRIFYGDFTRNGRIDIVDTYYDEQIGGDVPRRKLEEYENIEDILRHVRSNKQFSEMTIGDMLRADPDQINHKDANTLKHKVFINHEGERFEAKSLPVETQLTAGFYAGVADMDNSGQDDIFISQNFFAVADPQRKPRLDSGRGLWLKGDGDGNFQTVPGHQSGVKVYGEQRGAALADYTGNGKVDLAVSQNAAATRIFENRSAERGIRVALEGPAQNRLGIGSIVRLMYADGSAGPVRYIQAGSGYWSQNSTVQILGVSGTPEAVEVTWFDGRVDQIDIDPGQMDYVISY